MPGPEEKPNYRKKTHSKTPSEYRDDGKHVIGWRGPRIGEENLDHPGDTSIPAGIPRTRKT
jgi:hypothetical protein